MLKPVTRVVRPDYPRRKKNKENKKVEYSINLLLKDAIQK
jgi:hypothetical protein